MTSERLDRILDYMDALGKRMDAYEVKRDASVGTKDEDGEDEDEIEKGKPKELAADTRKDSVCADSDADAEEIENYKRETGATRMIAADKPKRTGRPLHGGRMPCIRGMANES